ncbi:MAG: alpha/beta fold hydrolase, partial [Acidimicrobiales bacterium]
MTPAPAGAERVAIDANGLTFSALVAGPSGGRPVLLLHGFPQSSSTWRATLGVLAGAGYHPVAPDQRGYCPGARPTDVAAYAVPALVSDVLAVADTMAMEVFDLVGHDWGGMLAWVVAARHPDRVRSLTVVSTPHPEALREVVEDGDVEQAERLAATDAFRPAGEAERLLLGEGTSTGEPGLRTLLDDSGLGPDHARQYVASLAAPGAPTLPP